MASAFQSAFSGLKKYTKKITHTETPLEKNLREATSNENWGVANSVLIDIARCTHDFNDYYLIMSTVWSAIGDKKEKWRRIFKGLNLLDYLLKFGSERVVDETRDGIHRIRALQDFQYTEEGRDKGAGIR
ncbi:hypothetical protein FOZ63_009715, partial [Perkinsus olseni]